MPFDLTGIVDEEYIEEKMLVTQLGQGMDFDDVVTINVQIYHPAG